MGASFKAASVGQPPQAMRPTINQSTACRRERDISAEVSQNVNV